MHTRNTMTASLAAISLCEGTLLNMETTIIRKANFDDLEQLYAFEQELISTERPFDPTLKPGLIHYYDLRAMINAPEVLLLVAELDNRIIGSGYGRLEKAKTYLKHPHHAYLGFMYVIPAYRGKGINQQIITALRSWAQAKNITELRLDVYFENLAAIKAYEKVGFTKHMIEMRLEIEK